MRKLSPDAIAAISGVALLFILTLLRASSGHAAPSVPSTYDAGANGYAALYEFLARERIGARRFELPLGQLPARGVALVVAGDGAIDEVAATKQARSALDAWVRAGNTLYVFGDVSEDARTALGLPEMRDQSATRARPACGAASMAPSSLVAGDFRTGFARGCTNRRSALLRAGRRAPAIAVRRGRGSIVAITTATLFDNRHLAIDSNAQFAYVLFSRTSPVAFDERPYGYAARRNFWDVLPWPMRAAMVLAVLSAIAALIGANLPFAPPGVPAFAGGRDSSAYIKSIARMLQRAGAYRDAIGRLTSHSETLLAMRASSDDRSREYLRQARELRALAQPAAADVLTAGKFYAAVRGDYE